VPAGVEAYIAMQGEPEARRRWDTSLKKIDFLQVNGPNRLQAVHGQAGDSQLFHWIVASPFPLKDREYVMHRRFCTLPAPEAEGSAEGDVKGAERGGPSYLRIDRGDHPAGWDLLPTVASGAVRVVEAASHQVAWSWGVNGDGEPVTRVRGRTREDPMTIAPKWLVSLLLDELLPRTLIALRNSAYAEHERRQGGSRRPSREAYDARKRRISREGKSAVVDDSRHGQSSGMDDSRHRRRISKERDDSRHGRRRSAEGDSSRHGRRRSAEGDSSRDARRRSAEGDSSRDVRHRSGDGSAVLDDSRSWRRRSTKDRSGEGSAVLDDSRSWRRRSTTTTATTTSRSGDSGSPSPGRVRTLSTLSSISTFAEMRFSLIPAWALQARKSERKPSGTGSFNYGNRRQSANTQLAA